MNLSSISLALFTFCLSSGKFYGATVFLRLLKFGTLLLTSHIRYKAVHHLYSADITLFLKAYFRILTNKSDNCSKRVINRLLEILSILVDEFKLHVLNILSISSFGSSGVNSLF